MQPELYDQLRAISEDREIPLSVICRLALKDYLAKADNSALLGPTGPG